jgi:molybdopterin converting factor small subunit
MIEVHLYGKLRKYAEQKSPLRESVIFVKVLEDDSIQNIVDRLGIPFNELSTTIFLNGEYSGLHRKVKDKDRLALFPDNMILAYRQYFKRIDQ